ncbi:MAG: hypothetical protein M3Y56_02790 [Armatimonadota bacterium]|nr:hypothetical protein [Armatimonadota bacterium]
MTPDTPGLTEGKSGASEPEFIAGPHLPTLGASEPEFIAGPQPPTLGTSELKFIAGPQPPILGAMNSGSDLVVLHPGGLRTPGAPDEVTGLPWLVTWGRVYLFVLGVFILYVISMITLSRMFA